MSRIEKKTLLNYISRLEKTLDDISEKMNMKENEIFERVINEMSCKQACPFNTLSGCKKDELNSGVCIMNEIKTSEWIRVADRLPKTYEWVLIYEPDAEEKSRSVRCSFVRDNGNWYGGFSDLDAIEVTHWMPLPEPPKEEEHE